MVCRSYPMQWHSIGLLLLLLLLWLLFVSVFKPFILPNILVHIYLHLPPFMTASDTWHIISTYQMHGQCISWIIVASPGRSPVLLKQMLGAIIWYTTAVVYILWCSCSKVINILSEDPRMTEDIKTQRPRMGAGRADSHPTELQVIVRSQQMATPRSRGRQEWQGKRGGGKRRQPYGYCCWRKQKRNGWACGKVPVRLTSGIWVGTTCES